MSSIRLPILAAVLAAVLCLAAAPTPARAAAAPGADVLVRFTADATPAQRAAARQAAGVERERGGLGVAGLEVVDPQPGRPAAAAAAALERAPGVAYAEPDVARAALVTPDDRLFGVQWALANTGQTVAGTTGTPGADVAAAAGWEISVGDPGVTVAVVDSGVELAHPDLVANAWSSPGETGSGREANGVDDDANGFVDDHQGWDFVDGDARPDDANGHGTHVAGTIGARGNDGVGVAGLSWRSRLLALRALDSEGAGRVASVIAAYAYARRAGARIVNVSLGGRLPAQAERDAITAAADVLFVVAAGNDGLDNDLVGAYPCSYDLPNVVCVAASDRDDALAPFSNRGARSVDLAAPGVRIASSVPGSSWAYLSGTSMAAPHVAGAAALALAREPGLSALELRARLRASVRPVPALAGQVATGGRLDIARLLTLTGAPAGPAAPAPPAPVAQAPATRRARADRRPPGLTLSVRGTRLAGLLRSGLPVRVRCSEACALQLSAGVRGAAGRALGRRGTVRASRRLARAGTATRRLRLGPAARARLRRARRVVITVRATATDAAGNRTRRTVRVVVRR